MYEILLESLVDSARMVPLLFLVYLGIELLEYRYGSLAQQRMQRAGMAGPALGAVVGSLPQCGFSVLVTALYTQRLATLGTLMAVYLSTSDEALPVLLAHPAQAHVVLPLILVKAGVGLTAGYAIDLVFRAARRSTLAHADAWARGRDEEHHHHHVQTLGCCGHRTTPRDAGFQGRDLLWHPVRHTLKIFVFVFVASFLIRYSLEQLGTQSLSVLLDGHPLVQPFLAALVGLIPNCAASVALAELYVEGAISYGATVAGLCASGGLGLLVLFREEPDRRAAAAIVGLLFAISVLAGTLVQALT
jgi:hypothetical protein